MPYVTESRRNARTREKPTAAGDVNYDMTCIVLEYLAEHGTSYTSINAMIGALECAKMELYRRIATPYEIAKISANGDVYGV